MKLAILTMSDKPDTVVSVMAAAAKEIEPEEFVILSLQDSDDAGLLRSIKMRIKNFQGNYIYEKADQIGIKCVKIPHISEAYLEGFQAADVTSLPKEEAAEMLAVGLGKKMSVYSLRWNSRDSTMTVGVDDFRYINLMHSRVFKKLASLYSTLKIMLWILISGLFAFVILAALSSYGVMSIDDRFINIMGFILGIVGIIISWISINNAPGAG